jgi:butyrate kinase
MKILAINPGSTTTKIAVYKDGEKVFVENINHTEEELSKFVRVTDQYDYRKQLILNCLSNHGLPLEFDAVIGRGGLGKPTQGGVYEVNAQLRLDMINAQRKHPCNLGCLIAYELAHMIPGCRAFTADPVTVDELCEEARLTGSTIMPRRSIWHALNQRAIAFRYAKEIGKGYHELNLIVAHLGGGISVAAHEQGKAVDVNNALDGEGPFSPERAGTLPTSDLISLCYSGLYTKNEMMKRIVGKAGVAAHLGTSDVRKVMERVEAGDDHARLVIDAMCYQVAKSIGAQAAVMYGKVDAILLTGGLAYSSYITDKIKERVSFLAPIHVYPGEDEMLAMAENAFAALKGEREILVYK